MGFKPRKNAATDNAPRAASPASLTAAFPKRQIANAITATTAGLIPISTDATCGNDPKRRYAHANPPVIRAAGRMKLAPATHSPAQPPRTNPTLIAISVDVGPGIRFAAPSMSRNCCRVTHCRLRTISPSIRAMWAAGPPKLMAPSLRNREASSRRRAESDVGASSDVAFLDSFTIELLQLEACQTRTGKQQEKQAHQHGKIGSCVADHEPEALPAAS